MYERASTRELLIVFVFMLSRRHSIDIVGAKNHDDEEEGARNEFFYHRQSFDFALFVVVEPMQKERNKRENRKKIKRTTEKKTE